MKNTKAADPGRRRAVAMAVAMTVGPAVVQAVAPGALAASMGEPNMSSEHDIDGMLPARRRAIVPVAALAAVGDVGRLAPALERALDAGLALGDAREILVQLYAYAGFPRSLNALGVLMKTVEARRARGVHDEEGRAPGRPVPQGAALLAAGTANQTRLSGAPVRGPLFEFAPAIDAFLKTHLFGDIFERDNLAWQDRELATVSMLAAMAGVEAQLKAHVRIAMNTGVTRAALLALADVLDTQVDGAAAQRVRAALAQGLSD